MNTFARIFGRSTFTLKIILGLIALLVAIATTTIVAVLAARQIDTNTNQFILSARDAKAASDFQNSMTNLQRAVQLYLNSPTDGPLLEIRDHQRQLSQQISGLQNIAALPDTAESFQKLITRYGTDLETIIILTQKINDLAYTKIPNISNQIDAHLDDIAIADSVAGDRDKLVAAVYVSGVRRHIDAARLDVQIFIDTGDANLISSVHENLDEAIVHLWTLLAVDDRVDKRVVSQSAIELMPVYRQTMEKIVSYNVQRRAILNQSLHVIAHKILKKIALLSEYTDLRNDTIRQSIITTTENATLLILAVGVLGLLLGIGFVIYISMDLIRSLGSITNSMIRLSKGDMTAEVPATTRSDEIGDLARAFHVFRQTATSLVTSEKRFRRIFEHAPEGICRVSIEGELLDANPAMAKMFGYDSPKDFLDQIGKDVREQLYAIPLQRDEIIKKLQKSGIVTGFEIQARHKDGSLFWVTTSASVVTNETGEVIGVESFTHDISERKLLEGQIRRTQKMEAIGQLTGGIAHDFNNILGIVIGNLELLQELITDNEQAAQFAKNAERGAERGAELTRKLLGFSRKDEQEVSLTSINEFIENMEDLIAKSLTAKIKVETHLASNLWNIKIDPGDLEDSLLNLSINARDAMPNGGALVIETANKTLDTEYAQLNPPCQAGDYVMVSVSDTGIGIAKDALEKIFEPFFTTKKHGKGTGLGLSMVYGFVQRSGGHLKIYSEPGKGTTIRIYLPRALEQIDKAPRGNEPHLSLPKGSETILVVDDEDSLRDIATTHLENLGYTTLIAENGQKALRILKKGGKIDLLFSDVVMPGGVDGYQLATAAKKELPSVKILLTSGFPRSKEGFKNGKNAELSPLITGLLNKPYNKSELAIAVRNTLDAS